MAQYPLSMMPNQVPPHPIIP
jgi:hypothetical protein